MRLLTEIHSDTSNSFTAECYEALFHAAFAKKDYPLAISYINLGIESFRSNPTTHLTHKAKTHLAILESMEASKAEKQKYLTEQVEPPFWDAYDRRKDELKQAIARRDKTANKVNKRLVKDLALLFAIRCKRHLLGMQDKKSPKEYVLNEARKCFKNKTSYINQLETLLQQKINGIRNNQQLPLNYTFFSDTMPPSISITREHLNNIIGSSPTAPATNDRFFSPSSPTLREANEPAASETKNDVSLVANKNC